MRPTCTVCGEREIEGSLKDPPSCKGEWLDQRRSLRGPPKIAMIKAKMLTRSNFKACLRMPRVHKANIYSPWRNRRNNRSITILSKLNLPPKMISRVFSPLPPLSVDSFEGVKHGSRIGEGRVVGPRGGTRGCWKRAGTVAALAGPKIGFYRVFGSGNSRGRWAHGSKSPFRAFKNAIGGPI